MTSRKDTDHRPIIDNFAVLSETLGGHERLRSLVLTLAIQGRLTHSDHWPDAGSVRKGLEAPFELPSTWALRRVDEVGEVKLGRQRSPKNHTGPHMRSYLRVANVLEAKIDTSDILQMNFEPEEAERFLLRENDILLNEGQSYELVGRPAIYRGELPGACFQNTLIRFRPGASVVPEYALIVFRAYMRTGRFRREAQQTTNIAHLSAGRLAGVEFPLPSIPEQKRIVAKVEQLMALCDELEAKQAKKREVGDRLTKAAFGALMSADTPAAVHDAWRDIATNLRALVNRAEIVTELRKAVVELAMRGGLTSRAADGMAVEMLLDKIRADVGSTARPKNVVQPGDDDAPFLIPETWRWVRWGDLVVSTSSGWSPQCESRPRNEGEWGVLKVSAVSWFEFKPEENKALPPGTAPRPELAVRDDDFLISRANTAELVGRSVVVKDAPPRLILSDKLVRCEFSRWVDNRFINLYNRTATARAHYVANASGTSDSMKNISRDVILTMPVPLPPLAEQQEIVARVEHFMTLCDDLEARLRARDEKAARLAEALVAQILA